MGGFDLEKNAASFLDKLPKELGSSFASKVNRSAYSNLLATIISWYSTKLFETPLNYDFAVDGQEKDTKHQTTPFYSDFLQDCSRSGDVTLELFFEQLTNDMLLYGKSYFLIDLPTIPDASNLLEQTLAGGLDPYLIPVDICSVKNWDMSEHGKFNWVIVSTENLSQTFLGKPNQVSTWMYYDQTHYAKYQAITEAGKAKPTHATLVSSGPHALSELGQVPLQVVSTNDKLWLGNRLYSLVKEYFNLSVQLSFSLWLGCNPIPVITKEPDNGEIAQQTVGAFGLLELSPGASFTFAEIAGNSWTSTQKYLEVTKEEIFRLSYVVAMGRSSRASATVQSAVSKEADMQVSAPALNSVAKIIKNSIQSVFKKIALIRQDNISADVRGMSFSDDGATGEVELVTLAAGLNIPSGTFRKECQKKVARSIFRDANAKTIEKMTDEIDAAPDVIPVVETVSVTERL